MYMTDIKNATNALQRLLAKRPAASCHCLRAVPIDGVPLTRTVVRFVLSHFRGSAPRLALLAFAELRPDLILVTPPARNGATDDFVWELDITVVGKFFALNKTSSFVLYHDELAIDESFYSPRGNEWMILATQASGAFSLKLLMSLCNFASIETLIMCCALCYNFGAKAVPDSYQPRAHGHGSHGPWGFGLPSIPC